MFKFRNFHPFMDADSDVGGGVVTPQEGTGVSSTDSGSTGAQAEGVTDAQKSEAEPATQKRVQTPEENAVFAEMRRKSDAAEKRAIEAESRIDIAKKYGQYGVYSDADVAEKYGESHGVHTVEEFEKALRNEEYQSKGIDPDMINKLIEDHPAIKNAKANEQAIAQAKQDQYLLDSFDELSKEYPDIKNVEDVPTDVWKKWNGGSTGLSLVDAHYLVNRKEIMNKQTDAAKQATLNSIQSKGHVRGNGSGMEAESIRVPDDVMAMYKKFNPGKTMDEYRTHYKKSL